MIGDWKTWLALALTLGPILLRFIPYTAPLVAAFLKTALGRTVVGAVVIIAAGLWIAAYYQDVGVDLGVQKTQERIEQQNERAVGEANEAAQTVEECFTAGREWDLSTGKCLR
jgi:hypothetical protein